MENISPIGSKCHDLSTSLYPICRSITGNGVRETLKIINDIIPLQLTEVKSGTKVFDWTIPKEWNIKEAYILNKNREKVVDFKNSNLHILNYSVPYHGWVALSELKKHLFTLPDHPNWIPYRTSYHHANWGFCMKHNDYLKLVEDEYEVVINSSLDDGSLTFGECFIAGEIKDEILISCHICHPSLCNDNLSGISVATYLAKHLMGEKSRFSYRFLFVPATIGAISWLYFNKENIKNIKHGLVATLLGDPGKFHYKKSRQGNAEIDKVVEYALANSGTDYEIREFIPYGYDERQYCSPGFNLPVGCLMRTPHGEFPEYHTSADNLDFVKPEYLQQSYDLFLRVFDILESNRTYINLNPFCEPQLGKRGLYQQISGESESDLKDQQMALLWILNQSDGNHNILEIAKGSKIKYDAVKKAAYRLVESGLLAEKQSIAHIQGVYNF